MMKRCILLAFMAFAIALPYACGQSVEYYFNQGLAKHSQKDYGGAIADFTRAIELNPGNSVAYHCRGLSKLEAKDYKGAIKDFDKAISINPGYEP